MAAAPRTGTGAGTTTAGANGASVLGGLWSSLGALLTPWRAQPRVAAADDAAAGVVPLLVRVLAGNPATSAAILACLNLADTRALRRLHPAVAGVVAAIPWCDTNTPVVDAVRWRAGLPGAVGARLDGRILEWKPHMWLWRSAPTWPAALGGVTHLDLHNCEEVRDDQLLCLPTSLCVLSVRNCNTLTAAASFVHLTALTSLDCSNTLVVSARTDGLPASLQELDISGVRELRPGASLAHLRQLQVLRADGSLVDTLMLLSLPPSLEELRVARCWRLTPAASFAHLTALRKLDVSSSAIGDASLATVPPSLAFLDVSDCKGLTSAAALPHLPALQLLDVRGATIGDALVASLPASLPELRVVGCRGVTAGARLDHLSALRLLHCIGTDLSPAVLAACRARGCVVPAAAVLHGHQHLVKALTLLADGRLVSGDYEGGVRLWDVAAAAGSEATTVALRADESVHGLAVLRDGRYLATGTASWSGNGGCVQVWELGGVPPVRCATAINAFGGVWALVALPDGRLAAGCDDGAVRIVDADAGAVATTLTGHTRSVTALVVLPDGALVSGAADGWVRVWDVRVGVAVATLPKHTSWVTCLAALPDGRLASVTSNDCAVRLWDVGTRACVGVLSGHRGGVAALAALPDGRLATASIDGTIRLWDARPAPAVAAMNSSRAVGAVPAEVVGLLGGLVGALLSLPDGRLACAGSETVYLLELPPPPAAAHE